MSDKAVIFWIALHLIMVSVEPIAAKLGFRHPMSAIDLHFARCIIGAVLIYPITRSFEWIGMKHLLKVLLPTVGHFLRGFLFVWALMYIPAVVAVTILTLTPAMVAVANTKLFDRERVNGKFWLGFLISFYGVLLACGITSFKVHILGLGLALAAVGSSVLYRIQMDTLTKRYSPQLISTYVFLLEGLFALLFLTPFISGYSHQIGIFGGGIALSAIFANLSFLIVIQKIGSTKASVIKMVQRPLAILAAALILNESLSIAQCLGMLLVFAGTILAKSEIKRLKSHEQKPRSIPKFLEITLQPARVRVPSRR